MNIESMITDHIDVLCRLQNHNLQIVKDCVDLLRRFDRIEKSKDLDRDRPKLMAVIESILDETKKIAVTIASSCELTGADMALDTLLLKEHRS